MAVENGLLVVNKENGLKKIYAVELIDEWQIITMKEIKETVKNYVEKG